MSDFPIIFSNQNLPKTLQASPFAALISPFDCNTSPHSFNLSKDNEEMLRTAKKTQISAQNPLNIRKIKEIISGLDSKTPFHLIFEDDSPGFDERFQEFVRELQEADKNPVCVLHELSHNLKVEVNVSVEPKIQGLDKVTRTVSYVTTVFLDNKIVSIGEGKSKSESKNSAAMVALKYLLSLDESCFENARFILTRTKKGSNSKQKSSVSRDVSREQSAKKPCYDEEVKFEGNLCEKRTLSDRGLKEDEEGNQVRKKLHVNKEFKECTEIQELNQISHLLNENVIWEISEEKYIKVRLSFAGHKEALKGKRKRKNELRSEVARNMLSFVKANDELQRKLLWRKSSSFSKLPKKSDAPDSHEEQPDFPPAFNLKLEESNIGNIYSHIDANFINRNLLETASSKDDDVLYTKLFRINETSKAQMPDFFNLKNMFSLLFSETLKSLFREIGVENFVPTGSYNIGCLRKDRLEMDIVCLYQPVKATTDQSMRELLAKVCNDSSLNEDFEIINEGDVLTLRGREQKSYALKIYLHNVQNLYYAPAVYHNIWMYESLRNKVISDEFVILHRLIRIWREKNSLIQIRTELLDSILFKVTGKYTLDSQTPSSLINSLKDFFECLASGVLLNHQSFIRNVPAHRILLEELDEEMKTKVTQLALGIVKKNDYEGIFA